MRLLPQLLIMVLLPMLLAFGLALYQIETLLRRLDAQIDYSLAASKELVKVDLDAYLDLAGNVAKYLGGNDEAALALEQNDVDVLARLAKVFLRLGGDLVLFADPRGLVVARAHDEFRFGDSIAGRPPFIDAARKRAESRLVMRLDDRPALVAWAPVLKYEEKLVGVVAVGVALDAPLLAEIARRHRAQIELTQFGQRIVASAGIATIEGWDKASFPYAPVDTGRSSVGLTLDVGVLQDNLAERQNLLALERRILMSAGGFVVVVLLFAILMSQRLVRPIRTLIGQMQAYSGGDRRLTPLPEPRNEVGDISRAFSALRQENAGLLGTLESKVAARTEALVTANAQLQQEMSDRQRAQESATESAHRLRAVLDSVQETILTLDTTGIIRSCNPAVSNMFGQDPASLLGEPVGRLVVEMIGSGAASRMGGLVRFAYRGGQAEAIELTGKRADGSTFPIEFGLSDLSLPGGQHFVAVVRDITERKKAEERIRHLAMHDALTGLPNRTLFQDRLEQALFRAQRERKRVAVHFIDLDNFKEINDTLGHPAGDALLREVATRLQEAIRTTDTVARLGGDEFGIVEAEIDSASGGALLAQRVVEFLAKPFVIDQNEVYTGASVGVTMFPDDGQTPSQLLKSADLAVYRAKAEGRGTYRFFVASMNQEVQEKKALINDLRNALAANELSLVYQPVVNLADERIVAVEALMRWSHPTRGMVSPVNFIPAAEASGLIVPIGEWSMEVACREAMRWRGMDLPRIAMQVNLSAVQFRRENLVEVVRRTLATTGLPSDLLVLEITESMAMEDADKTIATMTALHATGVTFAVDDFGTGYSSLAYLRRFPVSKVKIDKSFIKDPAPGEQGDVIAEAVVNMGRSLHLKVVAEGVETQAQIDHLRGIGCHEIQGYYYARPMPAEELIAWVRARHPAN